MIPKDITPPPGSLVFCHSSGLIGWAIRLGERLRFRTGDFYNHVGVIDTDGTVIQAEARGVRSGSLLESIAPVGSYEIVVVPNANPAEIVRFAKSQVGSQYGFLTILSVATRILIPRWLPFPTVRSNRTWICSALSAESARFGGWLHDWPDLYCCVPSEVYAALKEISVRDIKRTFIR